MKTRIILEGLFILMLFSSCAKEPILLSAGTGGYGSIAKSEKPPVISIEKTLDERTEAVLLTASADSTELTTTYKQVVLQKQKLATVRTSNTPANHQFSLKQKKGSGNKMELALNPLATPVYKKGSALQEKDPAKNSDRNTFSILSFACGLGAILFVFLFGSGIACLLGIPAIIFGIIGLARKEKLKGLAIAGLILGLLEIAVLTAVIIFLLNY